MQQVVHYFRVIKNPINNLACGASQESPHTHKPQMMSRNSEYTAKSKKGRADHKGEEATSSNGE